MTLGWDSEWLTRLLCALIWYVMSLALCIEIFALIGWMVGHLVPAIRLAVLLHGCCWLWMLRSERGRR